MALALNGAFLALSMIPLAIDFFPKPYKATTTVRIGVGLAQESDLGNGTIGGNIPNIALFDGNGNQLGTSHGKKTIKSGEFKDIVVKHHDHTNNAPAEYISITSGGTDQICIAYLAITMASGDKNQFYGDVGKQCGGKWYPSNLLVETNEDPEFKPSCIWLDSPDPGTGDEFAQGFSIHVPDFGSNQVRAMGYQENPATMCESKPRFHLWGSDLTSEKQCIPVFSPPLAYQSDGSDPVDTSLILVDGSVSCTPGPGVPMHAQINAPMNASQMLGTESNGAKRRSKIRRSNQACGDSSVVISDHIAHSAQEVCDSTTSMGPDFVSTQEGLYCDMCTHTIYNVCTSNMTSGCFDVSSQTLKPGASLHPRDLNTLSDVSHGLGSVPAKSYDKVIHWT
ncbi:hypothetical protein HO133_009927 [Letharia lupina]|uniref:Uncharacterized protein n=1 Tax=Letharia lupina TaxID=560253 RepID=A0A8H6FEB6_9LECA|nr:uncharacterized protein HO133_009927 [Letharia lupina]KAF6224734.1 hypothetical protein HO133_009927 [Letharia lupina]